MKSVKLGLVLALALVVVGCGKKKEAAPAEVRGTVLGQVALSTSLQQQLERTQGVSLKDSCFQLVQLTSKKVQVIEISNTACPKKDGELSSSVIETLTLESPIDPKNLKNIDSDILITKGDAPKNIVVGSINKVVQLAKGDKLAPTMDHLCTPGFKPTGYNFDANLQNNCSIGVEKNRVKEVKISSKGQLMTLASFKSQLDGKEALTGLAAKLAAAEAQAKAAQDKAAAQEAVINALKTQYAQDSAKLNAEIAKANAAATAAKGDAASAKTDAAAAKGDAASAKTDATAAKGDAASAKTDAAAAKGDVTKATDAIKASQKEQAQREIVLREGLIKLLEIQKDEAQDDKNKRALEKQIQENKDAITKLKG